MTMLVTMRLLGAAWGGVTPFDGEYLVEYDPERDGVDPDGQPMACVLRTTADRELALQLPQREAIELWRRVCRRSPVRPDGKPNRPLTAFTVEFTRVDADDAVTR